MGFLQKRDCNYASLIINKNVYSYGLLNDIDSYLQPGNNMSKTICFNTRLELEGDEDDVLRIKLKNVLDLYRQDEDVTIVYLGYSTELMRIIRHLNSLLLSDGYSDINQVKIISSEAAINDFDRESFNKTLKIKLFSVELKTISATQSTSLIVYYSKLVKPLIQHLNDTDYRLATFKRFPWIFEFIMTVLKCRFNDTSIEIFEREAYKNLPYCNFSSLGEEPSTSTLALVDSQYLRFLIYSLAALESKIVEIRKSCKNCSEFLTSGEIVKLTNDLRNTKLDLRINNMIPYDIRGQFAIIDGKFDMKNVDVYVLSDYFNRLQVILGFFLKEKYFVSRVPYFLKVSEGTKCFCVSLFLSHWEVITTLFFLTFIVVCVSFDCIVEAMT